MEPYEMWHVERTDTGDEVLVSDEDVEDVTEAILAEGADCYVKAVIIH